jgi:type VI secretion system lysozyme-like protein
MPRERSLLERLRDPDADRAPAIRENTARLADSVLANLQRLLNSRHGITPIQADYGIPDLSDLLHSFPEATARMRAAIKAAIEKYEPRLRRVTVKQSGPTEEIFSLRLEITGELVSPDEKTSVWFETRIDPSGRVLLKS